MIITAGQIKTIIQAELEQETIDHDAAEEVAAWADAHADKLLTERNKPKGWRIVKSAGTTYLYTEAYWRGVYQQVEDPGPRVSLLVDWSEVSVRILGAAVLRECSPAYFAAALERNEARRALLDDPDELRAIARTLNAVAQALTGVAVHLPPSVPDRYLIIEAAGLQDVTVGRLVL
jgi:hypothetical protein